MNHPSIFDMIVLLLTVGKPLLGIFTAELVFNILSLLLGLMTLAFTWGFVKDIKN